VVVEYAEWLIETGKMPREWTPTFEGEPLPLELIDPEENQSHEEEEEAVSDTEFPAMGEVNLPSAEGEKRLSSPAAVAGAEVRTPKTPGDSSRRGLKRYPSSEEEGTSKRMRGEKVSSS
jgi:hypothetical protein